MAIVTPGADTAHVPESTALTKITQAYRYEIDPTPEQVTALRSHIGATRFCYNVLLGLVKENWDANRSRKQAGEEVPSEDYLGTSHFDLQRLWYERRDEIAPGGLRTASAATTTPTSISPRPSPTGRRVELISPPSRSAVRVVRSPL